MCSRLIIKINLLFIILTNFANCEKTDYYWREYFGDVPKDALPGGKDINGHDTYIGQVYVHGHGLFVTQIFPGTTEVEIPCYGYKKSNKIIKILCSGHKENFSWLSTTHKSFHLDTINKHVVVGGYDHVGDRGAINIGRLMFQGILKIGQVSSFNVENAVFHFVHNKVEQKATVYEVLVYGEGDSTLLDLRIK